MKNDFYKFPSTPHLAVPGNNIRVRDDKVLLELERQEFLRHKLVIEEKVDGANLGISFDESGKIRLQNRGAHLNPPFPGQWKKLAEWLKPKELLFFEKFSDRYILFGEWCYARHSVFYNRLPDWFLGFDIFDKIESKFLSCPRRNSFFLNLGINKVPEIKQAYVTNLEAVSELLSISCFGSEPAEGLYLRLDKGDWLESRAKLVRPEFIQSIKQHWSQVSIKTNQLLYAN